VSNTFAPAVLIGALVPNSGNTANGMVLDDGKTVDRGPMNHQGILLAPRFGFAYDVTGTGKTAIRGGFGINYNARERVLLLDVAQTPPVQYTPTIYYGAMSSLFSSGAGTLFPVSTAGLSVTGKVPSVYNYSIGIQHNVGFNTVLDVAYVGALGRHLLDERNLNALPYGFRFLPQNQDTTTGRPLPDTTSSPTAAIRARSSSTSSPAVPAITPCRFRSTAASPAASSSVAPGHGRSQWTS
jgi:hypothetical protein